METPGSRCSSARISVGLRVPPPAAITSATPRRRRSFAIVSGNLPVADALLHVGEVEELLARRLRRRLRSRRARSSSTSPTCRSASATGRLPETIANDLRRLGVAEVIAAGGGTRNPTLMRALEQRLPGVSITTIDAYGIAEGAKEALV